MPGPPRVDVFIPCYNYGRYLRACVASALQPGGPPVRILIIDDASTDETPAVAAQLTAEHPNVSCVRHSANAGHIGTYNEGLRWATSEFFQFLSADDVLAPGALQRAVLFFDAHPDVGLVYGRTRTFLDQAPVPESERAPYTATLIEGAEFLRRAAASGVNPIANPAAVLVRTPLQHTIGGYRHDLPHTADMEMWLRFAAHAGVGYLDVDQTFYRRHPHNMSLGYCNVHDYLQRLMAWEMLCATHGDRIPDRVFLLQSAKEAMAEEILWKSVAAFEGGHHLTIDEHLRLALAFNPRIRRHRSWWTLHIKRLLGRRLALRAAPLVEAMRKRPVHTLAAEPALTGDR